MGVVTKIKSLWRNGNDMPAPEILYADMDAWFQSPLGSALLAREMELLEPVLARIFGYHFLQLGVSRLSLLEDSPIGHKVLFVPSHIPQCKFPVANNEALPLQTGSVDAVLIHHALDYTPDSYRLLREAARVLMPGGKLLVIGFNPLSCWGMRKIFRMRDARPWDARYISSVRVSDWLRLLDFSIDKVSRCSYLLPVNHARLVTAAPQFESIGKRVMPALGASYLLLACKQVIPITPIVPRWPRLPRPVIVRPAGETARTSSQASKEC